MHAFQYQKQHPHSQHLERYECITFSRTFHQIIIHNKKSLCLVMLYVSYNLQ
jgi:hypothetical protein